MQEFRRFTEGTLGKVILVIMILPFVVAGFYGYFASGASADQVAKVGDHSISKSALNNKVQSARQRLRQSNPNISSDMVRHFVSPQRVLDNMINNALLDEAADQAHMRVSSQQISHEIVAAPSFKDKDGHFSHDLFVQKVNRMGYSASGFIAALQKQSVREQLKSAYTLTDFALPKELAQQQQLTGQTRSVAYTQVSLAATAKKINVSDKAARSFYKAHSDNYRRPPQIRIKWIEIDPANYTVKVSDKQVKQEYNARKQVLEKSVSQNQERQLDDIFVAITPKRDAKAAAALAHKLYGKLGQGADFAKLAKQHSDDPLSAKKGGDLGWLMQSALPPAVGKAAFALAKGAVSKPVKTEQGYHIVKVNAIKAQAIPSLDSMRASIVKDIKKHELLAKVSAASGKLGDLAYEHSGLAIPADKLGLKLHTSDWFNPKAPSGFAANPKIAAALNDDGVMDERRNSDLVDLGNNRYAVIHVTAKRKAAQLSYAKVADRVQRQLKLTLARKQLAKLRKQAAKDANLKQVAASWQSSIDSLKAVKRRDSRLDADIVKQLFALPPVASAKPHLLADNEGNLWALTLTDVAAGKPPAAKEQRTLAMARASNSLGNQSFNAYIAWLRSTEEIKVNQAKLAGMH